VNIRRAPLIEDVKIYTLRKVSKPTGRKRLERLEAAGVVSPMTTPTGRRLLSIEDAERLAEAL
jgi:hypothetical protein